MKKLIPLFLTVITFTSCSVSQFYHFDKDMSGNFKMEMDMKQLLDMMGQNQDSIDMMWAEVPFDSLENEFNAIEGLSNVKFSVEENIMHYQFDFEDIESLNNISTKFSENLDDQDDEMGGIYDVLMNSSASFSSPKKNVFRYDSPDLNFTSEELDSLGMMMEMFTMKSEYQFEQTIKKVDNEMMTISEDGKSVIMEGNFLEFMNAQKSSSFELKLK